MCRPEPVSPDSPYTDPGPKRLTAALSPSGCQAPAADGSRLRPPLRTAARGGPREPAGRRPTRCPRQTPRSPRQASDLRIPIAFQAAGQGVAEGGAPCGPRPARTRESGRSPTGGSGAGLGRAATGRRPRPAASAHTPDPCSTRSGTPVDDGRKSPVVIGPAPSRSPSSAARGRRDHRFAGGRHRPDRPRPTARRGSRPRASGTPVTGTGAAGVPDVVRGHHAAAHHRAGETSRTRPGGVRTGAPPAGPVPGTGRVTRRCRRDPCCPARAADRTGARGPSAPGP